VFFDITIYYASDLKDFKNVGVLLITYKALTVKVAIDRLGNASTE